MGLKEKLTALINEESREQDSDTPDFILAEYMINCLEAFELASNKREVYYKRPPLKYKANAER